MLLVVINLLHTKIGRPFEQWIKARVEEHHEGLAQNDAIEMDPEVYEAWENSKAVSRKYSFHVILTHSFIQRPRAPAPT